MHRTASRVTNTPSGDRITAACAAGCWSRAVIHPESRLRLNWVLLGAMLMCYDMVVMPLQLSTLMGKQVVFEAPRGGVRPQNGFEVETHGALSGGGRFGGQVCESCIGSCVETCRGELGGDGGLLQGGIVHGSISAAETGGRFPTASDLCLRASGRRRLIFLPVNILT